MWYKYRIESGTIYIEFLLEKKNNKREVFGIAIIFKSSLRRYHFYCFSPSGCFLFLNSILNFQFFWCFICLQLLYCFLTIDGFVFFHYIGDFFVRS